MAVGACAAPSAEKSSADGTSERAKARAEQPWWKLSQYSRPGPKHVLPSDMRPGKGLLSNDEEGFVLYRKGEGVSSNPTKPTKVRR